MISIVDYGVGNINAFANIYKRLNVSFSIAKSREDLDGAEKIVLPGVGAFDHAMSLLNKSGMRESLDELVLHKKIPVIGVCVGMQIMAASSEEGRLSGLGWIDAKVKKIDTSLLSHKPGVPHMGWNETSLLRSSLLFDKIDMSQGFYFLHTYYFDCNNPADILTTSYYGCDFASSINSGNIYGCQFHPEKSLENGVTLLKNFARSC